MVKRERGRERKNERDYYYTERRIYIYSIYTPLFIYIFICCGAYTVYSYLYPTKAFSS